MQQTLPKLQIAVLDRGFVYVGICTTTQDGLTITHAQNIRRWGSDAGLGKLALHGPQPATKLDATGTVNAPLSSVIHLIDCDPAKWPDMPAADLPACLPADPAPEQAA